MKTLEQESATMKNDMTKVYAIRGLLMVFIFACASTIACGGYLGGGECQEYDESDTVKLLDGLYESVQGGEDVVEQGSDETAVRMADFPQAGVEESELEFDRENERVTVRYEKNGEQIVETWRVTGYSTRQW